MTEITNQRQAIEALAKWGLGESWAADYYASLMRENVAALLANSHDDNALLDVHDITKAAIWQTIATIQSLVEGASDD